MMPQRSSAGRRPKRSAARHTTRETRNRHLTFESLEDRRLLALTNLAAIEGTLFYELPGGVERPISGQPVRLYQDGNGNGLYDGAPTDPLQGTQRTNADGYYRFDSLSAATYFVEQPPEPSGHIHPAPVPVVRTIVITPDDANGSGGWRWTSLTTDCSR